MTWLFLLFSLLIPPDAARALEDAYSRQCEFRGSPSDHVDAAFSVGVLYNVAPELLLAIAGHESCFDNTVVTGKCSGVMQTVGLVPPTLLEGYERGAQEIRSWITWAKGDLRVALAGYSGGVKIAQQCRSGGSCSYADLFIARAKRLRAMFSHRRFLLQ